MLASPIAYTQYFLTSSALRLLDFKAAKKIGKCKYLLLSSSLLTKVPEAFPQDCLPMPKSHPLPVSEWPLTFVVAQLLPSLCLTSRITYSDDNRKLTGIKHPRVVSYITSFQIFFTSPPFCHAISLHTWSITTNSLLHASPQISQEFLPAPTNGASSFHFLTRTCVQCSRTPGCSPSLRKPRRRRISPIYLHAASVGTSCLVKQTFEAELVCLAARDVAHVEDKKIAWCETIPAAVDTDSILTASLGVLGLLLLCRLVVQM